jgi:hypothetical protein
MWQDEYSGGVKGVTVDLDERVIQWWDEPGCACGDNANDQSIADFIANGARHGSPPADVEAEMRAELAAFAN